MAYDLTKYSAQTRANIAALGSALGSFTPSNKGEHGEERGSKRIATDAQIAELSSKLWADPAAMQDKAAITDEFFTHKAGFLSKMDPYITALAMGVLSAGAFGAFTAGAGGGAGTGAAGLTADQALAQSAAGLSVAGPAETAATLGVGEVSALSGGSTVAGVSAANQTGTGAGIGNGSGAVAPSGAKSAIASLSAKDVMSVLGLLASLGSLIGGDELSIDGGDVPKAPDTKSPFDNPAVEQSATRQRRNNDADMGKFDTILTGPLGLDSLGGATGKRKTILGS